MNSVVIGLGQDYHASDYSPLFMQKIIRPGDVPVPSQEALQHQFGSVDPLRLKQLETQDSQLSADIARAIQMISEDHGLVRLRNVISEVQAGVIPEHILGQMRHDLTVLEDATESAQPKLKLVS